MHGFFQQSPVFEFEPVFLFGFFVLPWQAAGIFLIAGVFKQNVGGKVIIQRIVRVKQLCLSDFRQNEILILVLIVPAYKS